MGIKDIVLDEVIQTQKDKAPRVCSDVETKDSWPEYRLLMNIGWEEDREAGFNYCTSCARVDVPHSEPH